MSLVQIARRVVDEETERIANEILVELKAECPKRTGKTAESFRITKTGFGMWLIGSTALTAYYADQGNGGSGRIIRPHGNYLVFHDTRGGSGGVYVRKYVHGYDGTDFVKKVADKHR